MLVVPKVTGIAREEKGLSSSENKRASKIIVVTRAASHEGTWWVVVK